MPFKLFEGLYDFDIFDNSEHAKAHEKVVNASHKSHELSHELIAGAGVFDSLKAYYRKHCKENGKPDSHDAAKEPIGAFGDGFIDGMETKGLDSTDKQKAKDDAKGQVEEGLAKAGEY